MDNFFIGLIAICVLGALFVVVGTTSTLSTTNIELEKLKEDIEAQENINSSLSMQVDELGSLSNIQDVAKAYGLSYNNDNIIVIK
jgi:cell division protein FtsL